MTSEVKGQRLVVLSIEPIWKINNGIKVFILASEVKFNLEGQRLRCHFWNILFRVLDFGKDSIALSEAIKLKVFWQKELYRSSTPEKV